MNKIASFSVDHRFIGEGVYISRIDGDITTYDMRMRKPNTGDLLDNATMHSLEHMFATIVRNSEIKNDVIYFGPMGCQTGFYLLVRNADNNKVIEIIKDVLCQILGYTGDMFGASEIECGNYRNLDVNLAKSEVKRYYDKIKDITDEDLIYSSNEVVGIIGAMEVEVETLKSKMNNISAKRISGIDFYTGTLCGKSVVLSVAGVGKVNAAICTQIMILNYSPSVIINTGVAGGHSSLNIGDIVIGTAVVQHDFDTSPIGDKKGQIGGINIVQIHCSESVSNKIFNAVKESTGITCHRGVIATGDQFICDREKADSISEEFGAIAYEMEGGSIGQVCYINNTDFCVLRSISDNGDHNAHVNFKEFLDIAVENTVKALEKYLSLR